MVIYSILEIISIGLLIPFVTIILSPEKIFEFGIFKNFLTIKNFEKINLQVFFTSIFILGILTANLFRVFVLYKVGLYSKMIPTYLSTKIYKTIINTNYKDFKNKNSAELVSIITEKMDALSGFFFNFLSSTAAFITTVGIISFLFFLDFRIASICFIGGVSIYLLIGIYVKKILNKNSFDLSASSFNRIKHIKESFGSIKQLIIDNKQNLYTKIFNLYEFKFRNAQFIHLFFSSAPRFIVEGLGIIFIACIILLLSQGFKFEPLMIISTVGVIAYSFQKLLPNINSIYVWYSSLINYSTFIEELHENLKSFDEINNKLQNIEFENKLKFQNKIEVENISFKYNEDGPLIIDSKSFIINKGDKIFLKGGTGSGKTTCLDILMGLLKPSKGSLKIDGKLISEKNVNLLHEKIAHVPQNIFLLDGTIKENIIFNFEEKNLDMNSVIESAKLAEIHNFINTLPKKYETRIGEDGALLSGGQKQRIGIARALFRNKEILTLDEATSALDIKTEEKILNNLNSIDGITIIQITHRNLDPISYDQIINF
tara:strand:- start:203 stop:1831 length:1629 start_codon:yes stop_codon:yes gene_type:complete